MKILLIRLRLIGDVVFTTPLIRALRRRYPHARLEYLVEPQAAPVVADSPHLDERASWRPPPGPGAGCSRTWRWRASSGDGATTSSSISTAVRGARC